MNDTPAAPLTYELRSDTALAWYYVVAHWRHSKPPPRLTVSDGPMHVTIPSDPNAMIELETLLLRAAAIGGDIQSSARTVMMDVASRRLGGLDGSRDLASGLQLG